MNFWPSKCFSMHPFLLYLNCFGHNHLLPKTLQWAPDQSDRQLTCFLFYLMSLHPICFFMFSLQHAHFKCIHRINISKKVPVIVLTFLENLPYKNKSVQFSILTNPSMAWLLPKSPTIPLTFQPRDLYIQTGFFPLWTSLASSLPL